MAVNQHKPRDLSRGRVCLASESDCFAALADFRSLRALSNLSGGLIRAEARAGSIDTNVERTYCCWNLSSVLYMLLDIACTCCKQFLNNRSYQ